MKCNALTLSGFYYFFNKYKLLLQFYIHFVPYALFITATMVLIVSPHYNHRNLLLVTCCHFMNTKWEGYLQ